MTISINPTWNGNEPKYSFDCVNEAVNHILKNPSYEYLQDKRVRPYGDIDHYTPEEFSEFEFDTLNAAVYLAIANHFESCDRKVSLYSASSFEKRKVSWRWVVPDVYVESRKHAKLFASTIYNQLNLPDGVKGDMGVYNANQKLRMVGTSKPNENRPLLCSNCDVIDTIVSYIPADAEFIGLELPAEPVYTAVPCDIPDATLKTLLDCISIESWTDYAICRSLIWACCSCGIDADAIHSYASKASNYGSKWVDGLIKSHNPSKSANHLFLRKYAKLGNPKLYRTLNLNSQANVSQIVDDLFALTTDENTVYDNGRYLMELPEDLTTAVKSMMGTGKTEQIKKVIEKANPKARILVLSGRRTFSDAIYSSIQHQGFVHYEKHKEEKGNKTEITCDRLVIQMSAQSLKLIQNQSYEIVICDEIETLLTMLSPLSIYKKSNQNYLSMIATFERLMKETNRVICLDAFLTDRTLNMLKTLRGEVKLIINTTLPYNKKCVEFDNENNFFRTVKKRIVNDKKKMISIWGTVKSGKAFHEVLTREKIPNEFYHKASDSKIKARDMADVNKYWAEKQSIGYTGTITVGINYTNKESPFNQASVYVSAWGPGARDYAQAIHRARELTGNEVLLFIHPSTRPCSQPGLANQEEFWDMETDFKRKTLEDMGESLEDYTNFPEWLKNVVIWNRNEIATNRKHMPELMHKYLELCGITVDEMRESDEKVEKKKEEAKDFNSVRNITSDEAEFLNNHRRTMSEDDHFALEKYYLCELVNGGKTKADQFLWETWLKNKSCVEHAYMMVHDTPNSLLNGQDHKVIELFSKDIPRFKLMKSLLLDWTKSWSLPIVEVPVVNLSAFSLRKRTEKDTPDQYCRELATSIENWCGYAIRVLRKRIRNGKELEYEYTMVYNYEKSVAKYIPEKFKFEDEPC